MGLEAATYVTGLVASNPLSSDQRKQGDDHLRLIKSVLLASFPTANKAFYNPITVAKTVAFAAIAANQNATFLCSTASGNYAATLPSLAASDAGWACTFFKTTSDVNILAITPTAGTIDGLATVGLRALGDFATLTWDGASWHAETSSKYRDLAKTVGGTADAITITMDPGTFAYIPFELFYWASTGANTLTNPTINKDGIGLKTIVNGAGAALAVGALGAATTLNCGYYDGTNVRQVYNSSGTALALTSDLELATNAAINFVSYNNTNPGVNGQSSGGWLAKMRNGSGTKTTFAAIEAIIIDAVAATEDAYIRFRTIVAGTLTEAFRIGQGLYAATLTDQGPGTGNFTGLFVNNAALASSYTELGRQAPSSLGTFSFAGLVLTGYKKLRIVGYSARVAGASPTVSVAGVTTVIVLTNTPSMVVFEIDLIGGTGIGWGGQGGSIATVFQAPFASGLSVATTSIAIALSANTYAATNLWVLEGYR